MLRWIFVTLLTLCGPAFGQGIAMVGLPPLNGTFPNHNFVKCPGTTSALTAPSDLTNVAWVKTAGTAGSGAAGTAPDNSGTPTTFTTTAATSFCCAAQQLIGALSANTVYQLNGFSRYENLQDWERPSIFEAGGSFPQFFLTVIFRPARNIANQANWISNPAPAAGAAVTSCVRISPPLQQGWIKWSASGVWGTAPVAATVSLGSAGPPGGTPDSGQITSFYGINQ